MDPVSALGVAGVALQFLDFGSKLLPKILRIYRFVADADKGPFMDLKLVATRLTGLTNQIDSVLNSVKLQRQLTPTEDGIAATARECGILSADLLATLKRVAPRWFMNELLSEGVEIIEDREPNQWRRLLDAVRAVRSAEAIQEIQQKLDNLRQQLMIEILAALYERFPPNPEKPEQHGVQTKPGLLKRKTATECGPTEQSRLNLADAIGANTQRMLDGGQYYTANLELNRWGSTPVGSGLRNKLRSCLYFPEIMHREKNIAQPHPETFEWIYHASESSNSEFVSHSFRSWLCKGVGVYWVSGKAGSGKSTLLKSIYYDPRTTKCLEQWSCGKPLIRVAFFFWNSGSEIQMSQEGMLRSLLYQCLSQYESLPSQWDTFIPSRDFEKPWTWADLVDAFHILIQECARDEVNYFFLIDGLDELNGSKRDLIDLLGHLAGFKNVKLCVSSRPWVVFEDAYKHKPSLTVQDLTRNDIKYYVTTKFHRHPGFLELFAVDSEQGERIINQVTTKASGVFLWVVLVVKSLLDGLTNGDSLGGLQRRLDEVPDTLEGLFSKMLDTMEPGYYATASELFQIFRAAKRRPTVICMSYAHEEDATFALQRVIEPISRKELRYRALTMKRRLNTCCRGLLEVTGLSSHRCRDTATPASEDSLDLETYSALDLSLADSKVEYLHRTVKDWLYRPDIWAQITSATHGSFNPAACLARAHLVQLKSLHLDTLSRPEYGFWDLLIWCTEYCIEVGKTDPGLEDQLLHELNRSGMVLSTRGDSKGRSYVQRFWGTQDTVSFHWASTVSGGTKGDGFLDFAVRCQLIPYLERRLNSSKLESVELSALLRTAVSSYVFAPGLGDAPSCNHVAANKHIITLLSEQGGAPDKNKRLSRSSPRGSVNSSVGLGRISGTSKLCIAPKDRMEKHHPPRAQNEKMNEYRNHNSQRPSPLHGVSSAAHGLLRKITKPKPKMSSAHDEDIQPNPQPLLPVRYVVTDPFASPRHRLRSEMADERGSLDSLYADTLYNFRMHADDIDG